MTQEKNPKWDLIEGIVEIRFDSSLIYDAILGLVYKQLVNNYTGPNPLPILQLPESVRQLDENLRYSAHYQFLSEDFSLELGPRVILLRNQPYRNKKDYIGWEKFYKEIQEILGIYNEQAIFSGLERIGVRYINFFKDLDIFEKTKIQANTELKTISKFLGLELVEEPIISKLQITNNAEINISGVTEKGSIIDIDSAINKGIDVENLSENIDNAHSTTKSLLLEKVLKEDYIKSTNQ